MNRLFIKTITISLLLIISFSFFASVDVAYANSEIAGAIQLTGIGVKEGVEQSGNLVAKFLDSTSILGLMNSAAASIVNYVALPGAGLFLSATAYLLDVSISLTLNIKNFVDATPAIYTVWKVLRDITGLLFIFYLLYAAIQMMTGFGKGASSYGATIKSIIIAGIMINFSFFIVSVSIDFSNVVSQAIYNAMIPNKTVVRIDQQTKLPTFVANLGKTNISNIFMNSLSIQKIYDTNGNKIGTNITDPVKITLIGIAGVGMMITTGLSFLLASLAFVSRLVILLFLLAFSSIWFAGWVIPELNKKVNPIMSKLFDQLLFMPVYLLLMYVGLTIINGSNLLGAGTMLNDASFTGSNWLLPYIIILINFAIVIVILNLPLMVGLSMGGWATDWFKKSITNWDARTLWKNFGGSVGRNTAGQAAYVANNSKVLGRIAASSPIIGTSISKNLSKVSSATFGGAKGGYEGALKARKKDLDAMHKKLGDNPYKEAQAQFRTNLPKGILGHLISYRANKEVSDKLIKDAQKKDKKKKKPDNIKRLEEIKRQIADLDRKPAGFAAGTETPEETSRKQMKREELEKEKIKLEEDIREAIEAEESDRDGKILAAIDKIKDDGDKGGKDEKNKDK